MNKIILLLIAFLSFNSGLVAKMKIKPFVKSNEELKIKDLSPKNLAGEYFMETHIFYGTFDDGGSLWLKFKNQRIPLLVDNLLEIGLRLNIKDQRAIDISQKFEKNQWSLGKGFEIKAANNLLSGKKGLIKAKINNGTENVDCRFTPIIKPWQPGDGKLFYGSEDSIFLTQLIPKFGFSCKYDGKEHSGKGWMIHTRTNITPHNMAQGWVSFEKFSDDEFLFFRYFKIPVGSTLSQSKRKSICYGFLTKGDKMVFSSFNFKSKFASPFKHKKNKNRFRPPQKLDFFAKHKGEKFRFRMNASDLMYSKSTIENLPWIARVVVAKFADPYKYRFKGKYKWEYANPISPKSSATGKGEFSVDSIK